MNVAAATEESGAPAARARSRALAVQAAAGDESAFRALVDASHRDILGLCYSITRDAELAADAAQAAWIRAWQSLPGLREPERLHSWLSTIAANEARALLRRRRRASIVPLEVAIDEPTHSSRGGQGVEDIDLVVALARLAPDDRALLALRYIAGLNATELAAALGISPSGTRARLARLLRRLEGELRDG